MTRARLLVALAAVGLASPAMAYLRTSYCADGSGPDLWWPGGGAAVTYHLSRAWLPRACRVGGSATDESRLKAIVDQSFATWQAAENAGSVCTNWNVQAGSVVTSTAVTGADRQNLVVWRHEECSAVVPASDPCHVCVDKPGEVDKDGDWCVTTCSNDHNCWEHAGSVGVLALTWVSYLTSGEIVDADMELHDWDDVSSNIYAYTCSTGPACRATQTETANQVAVQDGCVYADTQSIVTHEAGHVLGLDHPCRGATCTPLMSANVALGTQKTALTTDDALGVCAIYPAGSAAAVQHQDVPATCSGGTLGQSGGKSCGCSGAPADALWALLGPLLFLRRRRG